MNQPLLGLDVGGTKIEVAALAPDDGRFLLRERVATPDGRLRRVAVDCR